MEQRPEVDSRGLHKQEAEQPSSLDIVVANGDENARNGKDNIYAWEITRIIVDITRGYPLMTFI